MSSSTEASPDVQASDETTEDGSPTIVLGDCLVCEESAHGLHFGVLSCRACAAFYRRTIVRKLKYKCRRSKMQCPINKKERQICRYCRFQKCIATGMEENNVRWHYGKKTEGNSSDAMALVPSSSFTSISTSMTCHPKFQSNILEDQFKFLSSLCVKGRNDDRECNIADERVKERIYYLFCNPPSIPSFGVKMSVMQSMLMGLHNLRRNQNPNPPVLLFVDDAKFRACWHWRMTVLAEWAMYTEEFRDLPIAEKHIINRSARGAFHRVERLQQTVAMYKFTTNKRPEQMLFAASPHYTVDIERTTYDFSFLTDCKEGTYENHYRPFQSRMLVEVVIPLMDLGVTDTELAFMLGHITWHLEGKGVSIDTLETSIAIRERMSNEFHDYYVHEMKMTNYASRLIKIMGVITNIENIMSEREKVVDLAKVFDVFKHDVL